jgi:16S rRNA (guanine966-N2)-methyltransferase
MRIIAGTLKGRNFASPGTQRTHPMSDKIKAAVFNILGDIEGLTVLDAFAGTGALCFESISRGAKSALAIELDSTAYDTIHDNIESLGLSEQVHAIRANISGWSGNNRGQKFDLVFCDPPYDAVHAALVQKIAMHVEQKGILVLSWPRSEPTPELIGFSNIASKLYGNAQLIFYRASNGSK